MGWNKSTQEIVKGYKLYCGTSSGRYNIVSDAGSENVYTLNELDQGGTYYFAASAYDQDGTEGPLSDEISYTVPVQDSDGDGLTDPDEQYVYGTDPDSTDTDGDGINDGDELALWGSDWDQDFDGDGIINLLDPDADGDGFMDGEEVLAGWDPADPESHPVTKDSDIVYAINAGDYAWTAPDGTVFASDSHFTGGTAKNAAENAPPITGTDADRLYQSERWGTFAYNLPIENGNYVLTLKFAEIYWSEPDRRIFDVSVEDTEVITDLDIVAAAGAETAHDVVIPIEVLDGTLNIAFNADVNHAKLSALIVSRTEQKQPAVALALNAGGDEYVDASGIRYQKDAFFTDGTAKAARTDSAPIADTEDDLLYQSERWGSFAYDIPLEDGQYIVTLKFAEIYWDTIHRRIFDVSLEGTEVITDLDLVESAGVNTAYDVEIPVSVTDGILDIDFNTDVNHSKLSAVLITRDTAIPTAPKTVFAVNAGGNRYVDSFGEVYETDSMFIGGTGKDVTNNIENINGTEDDYMYRSERWGTFGYAIPLPNGTYDVVVKCAELYWSDPGRRIFDITAEGQIVADDLDMVAEIGSLTAHDITSRIEVKDGMLNIDFTATKNHGQVCGILVRTVTEQ